MNVYLRPLVEELKKLWTEGVRVTDISSSHINRRTYVTKAVLMWTMHDYPGYGIASSLQTQGYHACPPCGPFEVPAYSTEFLGKIIYHGHRKFLVRGHKWRARRNNALWGGYDEESKEPPKRWTWVWVACYVDSSRRRYGAIGDIRNEGVEYLLRTRLLGSEYSTISL